MGEIKSGTSAKILAVPYVRRTQVEDLCMGERRYKKFDQLVGGAQSGPSNPRGGQIYKNQISHFC